MTVRGFLAVAALATATVVVWAAPTNAAGSGIGTISIASQASVLPGGTAAVVHINYTCTAKRGFPEFFVSMVQKGESGQIVSGFSGVTVPPAPVCDGDAHKMRALITPGSTNPTPGWLPAVASVTAQIFISNNQGESAGVSAVRSVQLQPGSTSAPVAVVSARLLARGAAMQATLKYPCRLANLFTPSSIGYLGPVGGRLLQFSSMTLGQAPANCIGASGALTIQAIAAKQSWVSGPALISYPGGAVTLTVPKGSQTVSESESNVIGGRVVAGGAASLLDTATACTPGVDPDFQPIDLWQAENDGNVVHYNGGASFCVKAGDVRTVALPAFVSSSQPSIISEPLSPAPAIVVADQSNGSLGTVLTLVSGIAAHSVPGLVLPTSIRSLAQGAALSFSVGYTCSGSDVFGVGATVSQVVGPHRVQSVSQQPDSPCTGQPRTAKLSLLGGPYAWQVGPAFLQVGSSAGVAWQTVPVTTSSPSG